jgi:2-polyprenyl-3-methyl-5-hydroxy-6-metoxy-1,4-benzoquinol methylase
VAIAVSNGLSKELRCRVEGWDISQTACDAATGNAARQIAKRAASKNDDQNKSKICFRQANVFDVPSVQFDFVYCSLFLHHFSETQAIEVLTNMKRMAKVALLVDDLLRNRLGFFLAKLGCYGLSRSPVVHFDGPQSVRAAFSEAEVMQLADQAQLQGATLKRHWPQRYLLTWEPKE